MIAAIFGQFVDYWRVFVLLESLLILGLYGNLAVSRLRLLLTLKIPSARKLMAGSVAKHIAICAYVLNTIARLIENWGTPSSSNWGFLIQISYIGLIVAWGLYERAQILIRRDGRVDDGGGFETR